MKPTPCPLIIAVAAASLALALAGCAQDAPQAPPVGHVATPPAAPPAPNWFERTGDATWTAVQQPVRWVTPQKPLAKPADTQPLYEAPDAIIVPRDAALMPPPPEPLTPTTQPNH